MTAHRDKEKNMQRQPGKISRRVFMVTTGSLLLMLLTAWFVALPAYDRHKAKSVRLWLAERGINVVEASYSTLDRSLYLTGVTTTVSLASGEREFHIQQLTAKEFNVTPLADGQPSAIRAAEVALEWVDLTAWEGERKLSALTATAMTAHDVVLVADATGPIDSPEKRPVSLERLTVANMTMKEVAGELPAIGGRFKAKEGRAENIGREAVELINLQEVDIWEDYRPVPVVVAASLDIAKLRPVDALPFSGMGYDKAVARDIKWTLAGVSCPTMISGFSQKGKKTVFTLAVGEFAVPATLYGSFSPEASELARTRNDEPLLCTVDMIMESRFPEGRVLVDFSLTAKGLADYSESKTLLLPGSLLASEKRPRPGKAITGALVEEGDVTFTDTGILAAVAEVMSAMKKTPGGASGYRKMKAEEYEAKGRDASDAGVASCYEVLARLWDRPGQAVFSFRPARPVPFEETLRMMFLGDVPNIPGLSAVYTSLPEADGKP